MPGKSHPPSLTERIVRSMRANTNRTAGGMASNASPTATRDRMRAVVRGNLPGSGKNTVNIKHFNEILKAAGVAPAYDTNPPWFDSDCSTATGWTSATVTVVAGGRNGSGFELTTGSAYMDLGADKSGEVIVGFAFQPPDPMSGIVTGDLLEFRGDAGATLHLQINLDAAGTLTAVSNGITLATATAAIAAGWQYVEAKVVLGEDPTGLVQVRVDGTLVIDNPDCDTLNAGTVPAIDRVLFGSFTAASQMDDVYIDVGDPYAAPTAGATASTYNDFAEAGYAIPDAAGAFTSENVLNAGFDTETGEPA